ncbi:hypothetical protein HK097_008906 [Rhizophlyctis rosea]|uniref:Uncharacterized protein n=1 Tax=Rhizophlyctis rosea TaxID=64517 RepID=A0AAD5S9M9_9FUNG|nr:hypothetical protein HK097_008906 [Rhizophlyctis rosea]
METARPQSMVDYEKNNLSAPTIRSSAFMDDDLDDQVANVLSKDKTRYLGISNERDDPFLVIAWNMTGLAQRRADFPDHVAALPAAAPPFAHRTLQNVLPLRIPRMNLQVADLNEILLYDDTGTQIGQLKSSTLPHLSLIKYSTVPDLQSAVNRLVRLCPILRSMPWIYAADAGNVFRIYPRSVRGSTINELESVHMNELDNEPFI